MNQSFSETPLLLISLFLKQKSGHEHSQNLYSILYIVGYGKKTKTMHYRMQHF